MNRLEAEEKNAVDELVVMKKRIQSNAKSKGELWKARKISKSWCGRATVIHGCGCATKFARGLSALICMAISSLPEANRDTALALEAMKEIGVEVIPDPTEWPRYKITFANGIEQWVFCRHAKGKKVLPGRDLSRELFFRMPAAPLIANFNRLMEGKKIVRGKAKAKIRPVPASAPAPKAKAEVGGRISSGRRHTRQTSRRTSQK